jgi:predicted esterase
MMYALAALIAIFALAGIAWSQALVSLSTRANVTQSFFLAKLPPKPQAIAILFPGSGGAINLRQERGQVKFGQNNFLVRARGEFVEGGVAAAVIDAPSDMQGGWGMSDEFRLSGEHAADIAAVMADLRQRVPETPLFLVGTSRGTISAASLGARHGTQITGIVLTSTMFRAAGRQSKEPGPGLSRFDFATIKAPLLFVHHASDQCGVTPYTDAARLSDRYPLITVFGGAPPQSGPCEPFSQHGFFGKERETVEQAVNWMLKKPYQHEVK